MVRSPAFVTRLVEAVGADTETVLTFLAMILRLTALLTLNSANVRHVVAARSVFVCQPFPVLVQNFTSLI